jgi:hypothetical protein
MAENCPDIPSRQANNDLYVPVSSLQQSGTDPFAEAQQCSQQILDKEDCYGKYVGVREFNDEETNTSI